MLLSDLTSLQPTSNNPIASALVISPGLSNHWCLSPVPLSFPSLNSTVNHTHFAANILHALLCLPLVLSRGYTTSHVNFNSASEQAQRETHSCAHLSHFKNMITKLKCALAVAWPSPCIPYLHLFNHLTKMMNSCFSVRRQCQPAPTIPTSDLHLCPDAPPLSYYCTWKILCSSLWQHHTHI